MTNLKGIVCSSLLWPCIAMAHGGGVDENGGHYDKKTNHYHCHRTPCTEIHRQVEQATQEAIAEKRPFTYVYNRSDWKHWVDLDGNCMNTRHEILRSQSLRSVKLSPDGCYVSTGHWIDPYSGKSFSRASDLDIDHIFSVHHKSYLSLRF